MFHYHYCATVRPTRDDTGFTIDGIVSMTERIVTMDQYRLAKDIICSSVDGIQFDPADTTIVSMSLMGEDVDLPPPSSAPFQTPFPTPPIPRQLTPEMIRAVRNSPLTNVADPDEWHVRLGWLICALDVIGETAKAPDAGRTIVEPCVEGVAPHVMHFNRPDDEHLEIIIDDRVVGNFDHDQHGWSGMESAKRLATVIAEQVGIMIVED